MSFFEKLFGSFSDKELKRINPIKDKVLALEPEMAKLTDEQLQAKTAEFKERLAKGETLDDILPEAFAVCREADWRYMFFVIQRLRKYIWNITLIKTIYDRRPYLYRQ